MCSSNLAGVDVFGDLIRGVRAQGALFGSSTLSPPWALHFVDGAPLTLCTVLLIKHGKLKYAWVPGIPLAWDLIVTMTASYQKVFSDNPILGYFAQRQRYADARDAGELLAPAQGAPSGSPGSVRLDLARLGRLAERIRLVVVPDQLAVNVTVASQASGIPVTQTYFTLPCLISSVVATVSATAARSWFAMPNSGNSWLIPPSGLVTPP